MLFYRDKPERDPFFDLFSSPAWIEPAEHSEFPVIVDIETSDMCNFECIFCSRHNKKLPGHLMPWEVYQRVVDETAEHGATLRVNGWGEPLMHPDTVAQVEYAKRRDLLVRIYTNGSLLTEKMMTGFIDAGLDEVQFSMQGVSPEQYEIMRPPYKYEQFKDKVSLARRVLEERGAERPYLSILTSILAHETGQVEAYKDEWLTLVDKISVDFTVLTWVQSEETEKYRDDQAFEWEYKPCVDLMIKIHINSRGDICMCGNDWDAEHHKLGNIMEMSIAEAWKSPAMEQQREDVWRNKRHADKPLCSRCYENTTKYDHLKKNAESDGPAAAK